MCGLHVGYEQFDQELDACWKLGHHSLCPIPGGCFFSPLEKVH